MEAAIRTAVVSTFEEYVTGLDKAETAQFPIILRNLELKPKKVNEELEDTPFLLEQGTIGVVKINPGWSGNVDVEANGIKVNLSFSPMKAAKLAMRPSDPYYNTEEIFMTGAYAPSPAPPINVPPRYCPNHDTSEKRVKREARECACNSCGIRFTSTYDQVVLCSACSDKEKRCIICGSSAEKAGSYIPANSERQCQPCPPGPGNGTEKLPPPPPGAAGRNSSFRPRQDQFGNLQPTDSIPVNPGKGNAPTPSAPSMPAQGPGSLGAAVSELQGQPPPRQQGPPYGNPRGGPPSTQQMPAGQQQRQQRPPQQQQRSRQQDDDENPLMGFLRALNCGQAGGYDEDDEYDMRPPRRQPPPRGPPGRGPPGPPQRGPM